MNFPLLKALLFFRLRSEMRWYTRILIWGGSISWNRIRLIIGSLWIRISNNGIREFLITCFSYRQTAYTYTTVYSAVDFVTPVEIIDICRGDWEEIKTLFRLPSWKVSFSFLRVVGNITMTEAISLVFFLQIKPNRSQQTYVSLDLDCAGVHYTTLLSP